MTQSALGLGMHGFAYARHGQTEAEKDHLGTIPFQISNLRCKQQDRGAGAPATGRRDLQARLSALPV